MVNLTPEETLSRSGIPYQVFIHHTKPASVLEAARERNQQPSQVIKTIIFRVKKGTFLAVLISGDRQISWVKLRRAAVRARLTTASAEEVFTITGCKPGTVSPFCIPPGVPVYVDLSVLQNEIVSVGSGVPGKAFILKSSDLFSCLKDPAIHDLAVNDHD
jgi:prolyl-tRNA editing enzyme YbaK/EbsC (Cys-tRNA(Pro) deacylase)